VLIFRCRKQREASERSLTTIANPTYEEVFENPRRR